MEKILCYALNRVAELENMLLPAIPETVWPAEVELIFSRTEGAGDLPAYHQHRLKHHINRMWLERLPVPSIVTAAEVLCKEMEKHA
ncbi:TPA_asm: hypothetical protein G1X34_04440 [Salmonella enterica subsp. enterica serovar Typhimurium str. SL1344]|nr:hypothetical protein [Salmonella enterica subsp. enterica serovar Newport]EDL3627632.1 hypothetical protein [Salmonella enterica subsp. enterica serovar Newport]EGU8717540.1 hypothetical protein [Salmonella enterica]EIP4189728.1 hypothetical protein [Salmonella enterica]HAD6804238.1 hypothetical protein [Salmonella enterica subsp. enterica serovar Typhimurium str. SL1344]